MYYVVDELNHKLAALNKKEGRRHAAKGISLGSRETRALANLSYAGAFETGFLLLQRMGLEIRFVDKEEFLEVW